jgi:DNA-binding transcriptional LysR family regulator
MSLTLLPQPPATTAPSHGPNFSEPAALLAKNDISLQQLRIFLAVAEARNVTEAAYALNLSQSTVSHSLAALEGILGAKLLARGRHGAQITEIGERVALHARAMLATYAALLQETQLKLSGVIRIASIRSAAMTILPKHLQAFRATHPDVVFSFTEANGEPDVVVEAIRQHQAEIGFCDVGSYGDFVLSIPDDMRSWVIAEDQFLLLWPREIGADGRNEPPSWAEIFQKPVIMSSATCGSVMRSYWQQHNQKLDPVFVADDDSVLISMVSHGLGITMMPSMAAQPLPENVQSFVLDDAPRRQISLITLPESLNSPLIRAFVHFMNQNTRNSSV